MKREISKKAASLLLTIGLILNLVGSTAYASGFSDVTTTTPNSTAILYLQDKGIVKGYEDGTFKPTNAVNRAELLKIIIEGSKIPLDSTDTTPFSDIDYDQWYAPYVKKAYSSGWINGYNDGTFRPTQTINKVEALKIIGKAQSWQLDNSASTENWYTPYVNYAEKNQYLEETGQAFSPTSLMTRGSISEIIYRTIVNEAIVDPSNNNTTPSDTSSDSTKFSYLSPDSFDNIKLSEELPNIFYTNEVYFIKGSVTSTGHEKATVILNSADKSNNKYFTGTLSNNDFEIPVYFKDSGDYILGLVPGEKGNSHAYEIHVNSNLPSASGNSEIPSNLKNIHISYAKDKTAISFSNTPETIKKITFTQKTKTATYLSRQNISSFNLPYKDFVNFAPGTIKYTTSVAKLDSEAPLSIASAFSEITTDSLNAVEHSFIEENANEVVATIPDNLSSAKNFSFTGTAKTDIKKEALIIRPDGAVDPISLSTSGQTYTYFGQDLIKNGSTFSFDYTPKSNGRYVIEINNKNSEPSINHPLYVGAIIPLIPDFFDLNERKIYKDTFDLSAERTKLFDLINFSRTEYGLAAIEMDEQLNTLAQQHSDDMSLNDYFSHYDLNGKTPEDRRIALGIPTSVGENLAKDVSVEFAHFGLMRSASHHKNILTPEWKKVGLGITLNQGELIITEEFSINPLTTEDLIQFKTDIINSINDARQSKNLNTLTTSTPLDKSSEELNNKSLNDQQLTNQDLNTALDNNNFPGAAQLVGRVGNPWSYLLESILTSEDSLWDASWKEIGANIQTDKNGKIYTIIIVGD